MNENFTVPKVVLLAETRLIPNALPDALELLGVPNWTTDAGTDAELLSEFAGKSCYLSFDVTLNKNLTKTGTRNNEEYLQEGIIATKHGSVLEHSTVSVFIHNVSRVVTHELVRHRAGTAFSQTSGRYVRGKSKFYYPKVLEEFGDRMKQVFNRAIDQMYENLAEMEEISKIDGMKNFSLKKKLTSAFRRILGNGQANNLLMTANHRTWRYVVEQRSSRHAEEEVRLIAGDIATALKARYPAIYADMMEEMVEGFLEFTFKHSKV